VTVHPIVVAHCESYNSVFKAWHCFSFLFLGLEVISDHVYKMGQ
jgi:hypothetical protein